MSRVRNITIALFLSAHEVFHCLPYLEALTAVLDGRKGMDGRTDGSKDVSTPQQVLIKHSSHTVTSLSVNAR